MEGEISAVVADALEHAKSAGLRYVNVAHLENGIQRLKRGQGLPLRLPRREDDPGRRARAAQEARDPPRLDRGVDLAFAARPHPGRGPRRARAQAVPLPRRLALRARRDQVRPAGRLRQGAARDKTSRPTRPASPGPAAREGARDRGRADGGDDDARRQRGVRAREPVVRTDHAARSPRQARGVDAQVPVQGQERQDALAHRRRPAAGEDRQGVPGHPGAGPVPVRRRGGPAGQRGLRRPQRLPARDRGRRAVGEDLPHVGRDGARSDRAARGSRGGRDRRPRWSRSSSRWRSSSGTRRRCAGSPTSIPG